jgi:DNA adenine methylase
MDTYPGGKNNSGAFQTIINQIPPHECYIEPFLGSGAIMRRIRPAHRTIAIDADASCIATAGLRNVPVIHGDAISLLRSVIAESGVPAGKIFIYADPPYLFSTRSSKRPIYTHEFGDTGQHEKLLALLKSLDCMVMLSGYWSELYVKELADWRTVTYNSITRSGRVAKEYLWMNYPEPVALHDYSFLGSNFRERERIKRKTNRWQARLEGMPILEKRALLLAMENLK